MNLLSISVIKARICVHFPISKEAPLSAQKGMFNTRNDVLVALIKSSVLKTWHHEMMTLDKIKTLRPRLGHHKGNSHLMGLNLLIQEGKICLYDTTSTLAIFSSTADANLACIKNQKVIPLVLQSFFTRLGK